MEQLIDTGENSPRRRVMVVERKCVFDESSAVLAVWVGGLVETKGAEGRTTGGRKRRAEQPRGGIASFSSGIG